METIGVSEQVKESLERFKELDGHTSFDSVIRELILFRKVGIGNVADMKEYALLEGEEWDQLVDEIEPESAFVSFVNPLTEERLERDTEELMEMATEDRMEIDHDE